MATVIRCDRTECVRTAPAGNVPRDWVPQSGHLYCSPRCATLALGGTWPGDPVPAAYQAALDGTPVDASVIDDRSLRLEVLEASLRGEVDRRTAETPEEPDDESSPDESSSSDGGPEPDPDPPVEDPEPEEPQP